MRGGLWTSAGLSSAHDGASGPVCLFGSSPEEALERSGRVLKGSGLSRWLRSEFARAGFRDSRWGGGARIWVHLESDRIRVSVSSEGEETSKTVMPSVNHQAGHTNAGLPPFHSRIGVKERGVENVLDCF